MQRCECCGSQLDEGHCYFCKFKSICAPEEQIRDDNGASYSYETREVCTTHGKAV